MPIYEYVCSECDHALEALQKISEAPLRNCPACDKDTLKKMISAPGFRLSGTGWYETDFKSKNQKNLSKGDSDSSSSSRDKPAGSGSGGKDSKAGKASKEAAA